MELGHLRWKVGAIGTNRPRLDFRTLSGCPADMFVGPTKVQIDLVEIALQYCIHYTHYTLYTSLKGMFDLAIAINIPHLLSSCMATKATQKDYTPTH